MKPLPKFVAFAALLAALAFGQPAKAPVFDVADVHLSPPGTDGSSGFLRPGRVDLRGRTMLSLIRMAYDVEEEKVVGGPSWLDTTRFDIIAKAAPGSSQEALRSMLQNLLAERFQLATHKEDKPLPVFVLTAGKRPLMKESSPGQPADCRRDGNAQGYTLTCHNVTMPALAESVRAAAPGYFNHPLIDRSGLKGEYDVTVKWVAKGRVGMPGSDGEAGVSMFEALEKQLGLKVEQQSEAFPAIVVDRVNEKPTGNPPGTAEKLPPPVTEFEVATIRPSRPNAQENYNITNGRIDATGITLKNLILFASNMDDDGSVTGGQKWLETDKFDIIAKASPTASVEDLRAMLSTLLKERFKLAVHRDNQPAPVFALTVAGKKSPKLKEADGSSRSGCKLGVENGLRTYTCQNTTMKQFAAKLRQVAAGYLDHAAVDLTGLKGTYDFAVSWSPTGRTQGGVRGADGAPAAGAPGGGAVPSAAEPAPTLTIFEAVEKQLGLKLTAQKHPMPVLVIDHVERTPTEN